MNKTIYIFKNKEKETLCVGHQIDLIKFLHNHPKNQTQDSEYFLQEWDDGVSSLTTGFIMKDCIKNMLSYLINGE